MRSTGREERGSGRAADLPAADEAGRRSREGSGPYGATRHRRRPDRAGDPRRRRARGGDLGPAPRPGPGGAGAPGPAAGAGRVPPHDLDAEAAFLGAVLLGRSAVAAGLSTCSAGDFYRPAHARVFAAVASPHDEGQPLDPVTVAERLRR